MVTLLGFKGLFFLFIDLLVDKVEKFGDRDVFIIALVVGYEPLEHFFIGLLLTLLIGDIIAEGGLLVELGQGIGCLFE